MKPQKLYEKKIVAKWTPKLKKYLGDKGKRIDENRLRTVAKMAHVRAMFENRTANLGNVVGKGPFSFGNNPNGGYPDLYDPAKRGSAEVFQNLFGVFAEVAAFNVGMELLPTIPMTKSSLTVYISEPVYADGRLDNAQEKPLVIQVKLAKNGNPADLVVGQTYTVTESFGGTNDNVIDLIYVGKHRINGNAIFRVGQTYVASGGSGTDYGTLVIADVLNSTANGQGIYTSGTDFWSFAGGVDYVPGFTNFISGFSGAGFDDQDPWFVGRGDGTQYSKPMSSDTGKQTYYRSLGIRTWSRNFKADTVHVDIEYNTEDIQDMQMDLERDLTEFGDSVMRDQLDQHINGHILGRMFALGWGHHYQMNQINGFNMNAFISSASNTGSNKQFLDHTDTLRTITGAPGVLPSTGAISENLNSLQRRIVSRMLYGSGVINTRSRRGRGNQAVMNTTFATAIRDVRGYQPAPFSNDIDDAGLYYLGTFYGMRIFEDPLMDLTDERINISRHGKEDDPGLKFCPYILAEKIETIAEGTMAKKEALKSRYKLVEAGSEPQLSYLTFTVQTDGGYAIV